MVSIMVCCLLSRLMMYIPVEGDNMVLIIISKFITVVLQAFLLIPVIIFHKKSDGMGILDVAYSKNKVFGISITTLYLLYAVFALFDTAGIFSYFLKYCFSETYSSWAVILVFMLTSVYVASMGLSSCARTASLIAATTIVAIILIVISYNGFSDFRSLNIAAEGRTKTVAKGVLEGISRSEDFIFLIILLPYIVKKPAKTIYTYLAAKVLITTGIIVSIGVILGDYALDTKLPFFLITSYTKTKNNERFEAFFIMFWTLCTIIKSTIEILCIHECCKKLFSNKVKNYASYSLVAICGFVSAWILSKGNWQKHFFYKWEIYPAILLMVVIPIIMLCVKTRYIGKKSGGAE